jgi:hypothetical protein
MKQQLTLTDISIRDKQMMFNALNELAVFAETCCANESVLQRKFIHQKIYSICSVLISTLHKNLNTPKIWGMDQREKAKKDKRWVLETYKAITIMESLNTYRYTAEDYQRARIDHIVQQIHKQLI